MRATAVLALALGAAACGSASAPSAAVNHVATVKIPVGHGAPIPGTPWILQFDSVTSDSRCPIGAMCVWQGEVVLAMQLVSPLANPLPQDHPHFKLGSTPVTVMGFRCSQVDVEPVPQLGRTIDPASYQAAISIDKIGS